jgi:hypothetical protein
MPARVSGFNCSHALPFNIDKRSVVDVRHSELLAAASRVVASQLSKPEN